MGERQVCRSLLHAGRPGIEVNVADSCYAIIALGSNQGDSAELIGRASESIRRFSEGPMLRSSLWKSTPVDCPPGSSEFVNAVVAITPSLTDTPENLLGKLQAIERQLGRPPKRMLNEARPIDLDLISYGERSSESEYLNLPHPRAHLRKFVLAPLAEILPEHMAPGWSAPAAVLLEGLMADTSTTETCKRLTPQ